MTKQGFPKMTRGHFEAIARELRELRPGTELLPNVNPAAVRQWRATVEAFAVLCHDSSNLTPNGNRAFDRERFLTAAGIGG